MAVTATELERLVVRLVADGSQLNRGLRAAENQIARMVTSVTRMGLNLSLAVTTPLAMIGRMAAKEFAKFEDAMNKAFVVAGNVTAELRAQMTAQAREMAVGSVTAAVELANAYRHLAASGMTAVQSMQSLPTVNEFAIAGMFDLEDATTLLIDAQNALGLKVKDNVENLKNLRAVANAITKAGVISTTDPQQIARAITTKAGAQLRVTGKSMEEGLAIISAMAARGVKAELAGEQLFMMLRDLQGAVLNNAGAWEKYGLTVFDANKEMRHTADILEDIEKLFRGMPTAGKKQVLMDLGITERSVAATLNMIGSSQEIREFEREIRAAGDLIGEMAAGNMRSFQAQLTMMINLITDTAITVGELLVPHITALNDVIRDAIGFFNRLTTTEQEFVVFAGIVAAAIGPVLLLIGAFAGPVVMVFQAAAAAIAFLVSPIGLATAAIAALVAWVAGADGLAAAWDSAVTGAKNFVLNTIGFFANFQHNFEQLTTFVSNNWGALLSDAEQILRIWTSNILDDIGTILSAIARVAVVVFDHIFSVEFAAAVVEGFQVAWEVASNWFDMLLSKAQKVFRFIVEGLAMAITGKLLPIFPGEEDNPHLFNKIAEDLKARRDGADLLPTIRGILRDEASHLKGLSLEGFDGAMKIGGLDLKLDFGKQVAEQLPAGAREVGNAEFFHATMLQEFQTVLDEAAKQGLASQAMVFTEQFNELPEVAEEWADRIKRVQVAAAAETEREILRNHGRMIFDARTMTMQRGASGLRPDEAGLMSKFINGPTQEIAGLQIAPLKLLTRIDQTFREQEMLADKEREMMDLAIQNLQDVKTAADNQREGTQAMVLGSQEAAEHMLKTMFGGTTEDERLAREQVKELKNTNKTLKTIEKNLRDVARLEAANIG